VVHEVENMKEHIKILRKFQTYPLSVLDDGKDKEKLMAAINKSIKLLQKADSRKKASKSWY
jgi:hypothetical protein